MRNEEAFDRIYSELAEREACIEYLGNEGSEYSITEYSFASRTDQSNLSHDDKLWRLMCYGQMAIREGVAFEHLDSDSEGELGELVFPRSSLEEIGRVWA